MSDCQQATDRFVRLYCWHSYPAEVARTLWCGDINVGPILSGQTLYKMKTTVVNGRSYYCSTGTRSTSLVCILQKRYFWIKMDFNYYWINLYILLSLLGNITLCRIVASGFSQRDVLLLLLLCLVADKLLHQLPSQGHPLRGWYTGHCARSAFGCALWGNVASTGYSRHLLQRGRISGQFQ